MAGALMMGAALGVEASDAEPAEQCDGEPAEQCPDDQPELLASVVLFGSSSINDFFGHLIAQDISRLGLRVLRQGLPAAGLSRPDFRDIQRELALLPLEPDTRAVLVYFGGNDAQALWLRPEERTTPLADPWVKWNDERWSPTYMRRVLQLVDAICSRGVRHAIVVAPADVAKDRLQRRLERIRGLQRIATGISSCGNYVPTSANSEAVSGGPGAGRLHAADGVHMTRLGAEAVWARIRAQVIQQLVL